VGELGRILGEHGVNIAGMQVSRDQQGGHALIAMTVDSPIEQAALQEIVDAIGAREGRALDLDNLS
jgi:D-3-phosphoglycerate dehydrogenase